MRHAGTTGVALLLLAGVHARAGDEAVLGTIRAEENKVWVDVQNGRERAIRLKSVTLVFVDVGGRPISRLRMPCAEKCEVAPGGKLTLGPVEGPPDWDDAEIGKIDYK
jgi:hypothetical protein